MIDERKNKGQGRVVALDLILMSNFYRLTSIFCFLIATY